MRNKLLYCILTLQIFFLACNTDTVYKQKEKIDLENWSYSNVLNYIWSIKDTADWYSMNLIIEHLPNLNYRNIYVKCITSFPDSSKKEQILSLELFDAAGKPFGKCSNSKCTTEISLIAKTKFQFQGKYGLSIEQFGRDSILTGLQCFELEIEKIKLEN